MGIWAHLRASTQRGAGGKRRKERRRPMADGRPDWRKAKPGEKALRVAEWDEEFRSWNELWATGGDRSESAARDLVWWQAVGGDPELYTDPVAKRAWLELHMVSFSRVCNGWVDLIITDSVIGGRAMLVLDWSGDPAPEPEDIDGEETDAWFCETCKMEWDARNRAEANARHRDDQGDSHKPQWAVE